jgi:hypothetical protein
MLQVLVEQGFALLLLDHQFNTLAVVVVEPAMTVRALELVLVLLAAVVEVVITQFYTLATIGKSPLKMGLQIPAVAEAVDKEHPLM